MARLATAHVNREAAMPLRTAGTRRDGSARVLLAGGGIAALLTALLAVMALLAGAVTASAAGRPGGERPGAHPARHGVAPVYYVALGDSLSQGVQPATPPLPPGVSLGQSVETDQGYADDLYAAYRPAFHGRLTLVKLGCPGETTASMLTGSGSPCSYPQGSQLAAALAFIQAHRDEIGLITIDIGANDVDGCVAGGTVSLSCVQAGLGTVGHDLPLILGALRRSAGGRALIAGMNLYDPFLASYLTGTAAGQAAAGQSVTLDESLGQLIAVADMAFGVRTADVQDAFSTADFTDTAALPGAGTVPLNVARICEWTWMCAQSPVGPNIHANAAGYRVIAAAFERAIGRLRPRR
jgi:lysophospholipase L1-like esterase